ncbi:tetratricopeptide repeat protein [bacterium]|nr:tetratricopeptide repeat protein [bacterium]
MNDNMRELVEEADRRYNDWLLEDAARLYEEAVSRQPDYRYAVNRLARCYAMQGQVKRLIKTCVTWQKYLAEHEMITLAGEVAKSILCFDPGSVEGRVCMLQYVRLTQGEDEYLRELNDTVSYFLEIDEGELAVKVLRTAIEAFPTNVDIAVKLADVLMAEGDIDQAVQSYRKIIGELESSNEIAKAADVYRRLEVLTPDDLSVIMRLAEIYLDNEKYAEAAGEYRNALRVDYSDHVALCGLGTSLMHLKDYNGAVLAFRKAVVIDPGDIEARERLAESYVALGNIEDAVKDLLAAGTNLISCEDYLEAQRIYETVLKLSPDNSVAVRELSNVKDALAKQKAREEQIRKLQSGGIKALQASMAAKAKQSAPAADGAQNEADDVYADGSNPYAGGTDIYGDDLYGAPAAYGEDSLGAPGADNGVQLGAMDSASDSGKAAGGAGPKVTRVLASMAPEGVLCNPVPFVVAKYADMIPLIQGIVSEEPSREVFGWNYLAELDAPGEKAQASQAEQEELVAPPLLAETKMAREEGTAVSSAFGDSSGSLFEGASFGGGGGLFSGKSFGVKSRFQSSSAEETKSEAGMSLVERIQMQQKQKSKKG